MSKITQLQLDELKKYRDYINGIGREMPLISETLQDRINGTNNYRFLLAILMGTELVKTQLRALVILDTFINELKLVLNKNGDHKIKKIKEYSTYSYGTTLSEFCKRYDIKNSDKELYDNLWLLNTNRNKMAHDSILLYKGAIERANEEIRLYIRDGAIQKIITPLIILLNQRQKENAYINQKLKEAGLI